jgi:O-antigen/teichoic acid export membrane protein
MGVSTVLRLLTGVVVFIVLARAWGPEKFGIFMYGFTLTTLASLVADYGFSQQLMREVARLPEQIAESLAAVMSAKLMIVAVLLVVALGVTVLHPDPEHAAVLWVLLMGGLIGSFAESYVAVFRGSGHYHEETVIMAWVNVLHLAIVCLVLWLGGGPLAVGWGILVSRVLFLVLSHIAYCRVFPAHPRWQVASRGQGWQYIKAGFPFAAESGFTNFQSQADTMIVHHMLGPAAVGVYQAGLRLMQGANSFAQVLSNVYLTAMAGKLEDQSAMRVFGNRLFWQMLLIGTACFVVFYVGAGPITHLLYGVKYEALIGLMPWFGLVLLARYVAASHGVILSAIGMQTFRVTAIGGALLVLFACCALLIPAYGLKGMLLSSLTAVVALDLFYILSLSWRQVPRGLSVRNVGLLVATVAVCGWVMQYQ